MCDGGLLLLRVVEYQNATNIHATNICLKGCFSLVSLFVVPAYKNDAFRNIVDFSNLN